MGKFVELNSKDIVKYEALTEKPFNKVFALENVLKFYKFRYCGQIHTSEVFYDTPNDILYLDFSFIYRIASFGVFVNAYFYFLEFYFIFWNK